MIIFQLRTKCAQIVRVLEDVYKSPLNNYSQRHWKDTGVCCHWPLFYVLAYTWSLFWHIPWVISIFIIVIYVSHELCLYLYMCVYMLLSLFFFFYPIKNVKVARPPLKKRKRKKEEAKLGICIINIMYQEKG